MKIIADENIPLVKHYFGNDANLILKPGRHITHDDVKDADMLLVRSVTPVNEVLLKGSAIKFVGSSTTGFDHIDIDYLNKNNISYAVATGCNAAAVVEYVISVIAALQAQQFLKVKPLRAAVIGVGRIGQWIAKKLRTLGFDVLECDPVRAQSEKDFNGVTLNEIQDVDFISLHTPLTKEGDYPTFHLINKSFLQRQKEGCILLNTGRGSVVDFNDLKQFGQHMHWCFDVWENEPHIDMAVLQQALIATPHIAGYSLQSKYRGIKMIYQAAVNKKIIKDAVLPIDYPTKEIFFEVPPVDWKEVILALFDPRKSTQEMKHALLNNQDTFDNLRKTFLDRYEFAYVNAKNLHLESGQDNLLNEIKKFSVF
jgi:erythronate-4-phosphate dehydrogenase